MVRKQDLIKKFGSEEKVSEYYRELQKKSRLNYSGTGGFAANKELAKQAGKKGLEKRWGHDQNKTT